MRAPAKRYLVGLDIVSSVATEPQCVAWLVEYHRRNALVMSDKGRFGRLLWKLFGRWL